MRREEREEEKIDPKRRGIFEERIGGGDRSEDWDEEGGREKEGKESIGIRYNICIII